MNEAVTIFGRRVVHITLDRSTYNGVKVFLAQRGWHINDFPTDTVVMTVKPEIPRRIKRGGNKKDGVVR